MEGTKEKHADGSSGESRKKDGYEPPAILEEATFETLALAYCNPNPAACGPTTSES